MVRLVALAGGEKNRGRVLFPVPLLACFLASADYSAVLPDFVVASGGLSKTGLAILIRVELDGDGGLILIGLLLACLAGLEKHRFGSSRGACRGFVPLPTLLVYIIRPPCSLPRLFLCLWR